MMQVHYLTGDRLYLRALRLDDKDQAAAWFDSPFPINATRAEQYLKEQHATAPWMSSQHHLALCRRDTDEIVGSVRIRFDKWSARLTCYLAPWLENADNLQAEVLGIVIPWLRDEHEMISVTVQLPADQSASIRTAQDLGMTEAVRLRRYVARPGGRVDLLRYQALNPKRPEVARA